MKKVLLIITVLFVSLSTFTACEDSQSEEVFESEALNPVKAGEEDDQPGGGGWPN